MRVCTHMLVTYVFVCLALATEVFIGKLIGVDDREVGGHV